MPVGITESGKQVVKDVYNEGTDIDSELNANVVGEYLFGDEDFVKHLSTKHNSTFGKIYRYIEHLLNLVTAGSKEARQLEEVKWRFEKAYKAQKNTANDGVKHSIVVLDDGKMYVEASRNVISGNTKAEQRANITEFFNELLQGEDSLDIQTIEGDVLTITKAETANKARDDYRTVDGQRIAMSDSEFAVKLHVESHIDEVAEIRKKAEQKNDGRNHDFAKDAFTYRRAYFKDFDGQYYEVKLSIGHNGTVATVYNVGKIKNGVPPSAKIIAVVGSQPRSETPVSNSISQNSENVNRQFSLGGVDGVKYSISPKLSDDLDKVLNGTFDASKGEVYLGETSNFMTGVIGAESLKVTMPASKVYSAMVTLEEYEKKPFYKKQDNYHGIEKEDFLEILEKSENPVAVFAAPLDENGNSRHNRIILVTDKIIDDVENGGKGYAVVVEEVDTRGMIDGKRLSVNKAITVYPRAKIEADISQAIADGRILDIKTKKDQFSAGVRGSNPQAAIRKTDLANNIAHFWANVKWENSKNKIFSAEAPGSMTAMQAA